MGVMAERYGPESYDSCANRVKKLTGIILIFHPGCGHCVQMRPEWEAMKKKLSPGSKVVEVDGSEMSSNEELSNSPVAKKVRGFPAIFRVKNGKVDEEFSGQRTSEEMKDFAEKGMKRTPKKNNTKKSKNKKNKKSKTGKGKR